MAHARRSLTNLLGRTRKLKENVVRAAAGASGCRSRTAGPWPIGAGPNGPPLWGPLCKWPRVATLIFSDRSASLPITPERHRPLPTRPHTPMTRWGCTACGQPPGQTWGRSSSGGCCGPRAAAVTPAGAGGGGTGGGRRRRRCAPLLRCPVAVPRRRCVQGTGSRRRSGARRAPSPCRGRTPGRSVGIASPVGARAPFSLPSARVHAMGLCCALPRAAPPPLRVHGCALQATGPGPGWKSGWEHNCAPVPTAARCVAAASSPQRPMWLAARRQDATQKGIGQLVGCVVVAHVTAPHLCGAHAQIKPSTPQPRRGAAHLETQRQPHRTASSPRRQYLFASQGAANKLRWQSGIALLVVGKA